MRDRRQAEKKWRNTKLTIFKDLYRQAKHKVSKLVHTAKCKFYTERIALACSSKELHQIVNKLSNRHQPKISLLSLSTVDRLKDLKIGYHLPRRHRSSQGVKRKKKNLHSFVVASFNAQSVKGNDMACKRCEISTFLEDNGVDLFCD